MSRQPGSVFAKANSEPKVLTGSHCMMQEQIVIWKRENEDLLKHDQNPYSQYGGSTSGVITFGKTTWENMQVRAACRENWILGVARSLSDLMAKVQKMHDDIEYPGEEKATAVFVEVNLRFSVLSSPGEVKLFARCFCRMDVKVAVLWGKIVTATQKLGKLREVPRRRGYLEERVQQITKAREASCMNV
ncbi:hypothetical protein C8T65DRAFT_741336 [Cerioporus squamosus]|nr:hypothetical protein C8T65DRAFT_741336 [Cerioporus squamosus]